MVEKKPKAARGVRVVSYLSPEDRVLVRRTAVEAGCTQADLIVQAVKEYVERRRPPEPAPVAPVEALEMRVPPGPHIGS